MGSLALILTLAVVADPVLSEDLPVNTWVLVEDAEDGGTPAGFCYVPDQQGMLLWGRRARRDWRGRTLSKRYWVELFGTATDKWVERVPEVGRLEAGLGRHSYYTQWVEKDGYAMPALPGHNRAYWHANQFCYLPNQKKVLYFQGGSTFTYDPSMQKFENLEIEFADAPPDVMLGSMVWNPATKEAILFGGGYLRAYQARPGDVIQKRPARAWTPDKWDRRGTWAFNPATNKWRRIETADPQMKHANEGLHALRTGKLRDAWAGCRGLAFEYDGRVGVKRNQVIATVNDVANALKLAAKPRSLPKDAYAASQMRSAFTHIGNAVLPQLTLAIDALDANDGWGAFHAVQRAYEQLETAEEMIAVAPRPRHYARMVFDLASGKIVLFGGDGEDRLFADTWLLDCETLRWERIDCDAHPPVPAHGMVAMDYDGTNKVVVLALQSGDVWVFDAGKRTWRQVEVTKTGFGRKQYPHTAWMAFDYAAAANVHVLADMSGQQRMTFKLRLELSKAKFIESPTASPTEVWHHSVGGDCPRNKLGLSWSFMPKTQAEYRKLVAERTKLIESLPANQWAQLKSPYSSHGRAYGSFCYDWDRDQIVLWGGGHSAYMGNEWSQYDLKSGLWSESWNPEYPPHPYGSPDGPGWHPSFYHEKGAHHGYHHYVYCGDLKQVVMFGTLLYDPDRMRYDSRTITKVGPGSTGTSVEMNSASGSYRAAKRYYRGSPFGVWQTDFEKMTLSRIEGSDPPFGSNDRAKATFDTKRKRILYYGAQDESSGKKCNQLYAFPLATGKWQKLTPKLHTETGEAPQIKFWNYCYSSTHDCLMIAAGESGTWIYDCESNTLKRLGLENEVGTAGGVVYSERYDLFLMLDGHGYRPQQVWAFRYKP